MIVTKGSNLTFTSNALPITGFEFGSVAMMWIVINGYRCLYGDFPYTSSMANSLGYLSTLANSLIYTIGGS